MAIRIRPALLVRIIESEIYDMEIGDYVEGRVCIFARKGMQVQLVVTTAREDFTDVPDPDYMPVIGDDDGTEG
jgi:hypothetical protein